MPGKPPPALQPVTDQNGPWPLHGTAAARRSETAALAQTEPFTLMARAGLSIARLALALAPRARRVQVWAGPGNNGGDGLVAAAHLHRAGLCLRVGLISDPARLPPDAARAWTEAAASGVDLRLGPREPLEAPDIVIDALLGLGATRAPIGELAEAIDLANATHGLVLAVDIPSGLHPDTGNLLGCAAVRASATLALLALKPGCFTAWGRDHAGRVWLDRLGATVGPPDAWLPGPPPSKPRAAGSHKGSHGDVAVVGGAPGMTGALWLAARAALAAGAGRVYACPLSDEGSLFDGMAPELMGRRSWWLSAPEVLASTTVACGCGGGDAVRTALPALLSRVPRLVLDADGLNAVACDEALQGALAQRAAHGLATVLTPHPAEAARLLGLSATEVQKDRLRAAASLADRFSCTVLLKGSGTVIATPGHPMFINPTGNAALASAGTGDVLSGWIAGLWAQQPRADATEVAASAAWQHGRAADEWRPALAGAPLRAGDLVDVLAHRGLRQTHSGSGGT